MSLKLIKKLLIGAENENGDVVPLKTNLKGELEVNTGDLELTNRDLMEKMLIELRLISLKLNVLDEYNNPSLTKDDLDSDY